MLSNEITKDVLKESTSVPLIGNLPFRQFLSCNKGMFASFVSSKTTERKNYFIKIS